MPITLNKSDQQNEFQIGVGSPTVLQVRKVISKDEFRRYGRVFKFARQIQNQF